MAYPDLAVLQKATAGWVTVDLVSSVPTSERLRMMLGRAHRDRLIASQLFLVEQDGETGELILGTAAEMGLADTVRVEVVQPDLLAQA